MNVWNDFRECCRDYAAFFGLLLTAIIAVSPQAAMADWKEFMPVPVYNGVEMELSGSYESDNLRGSARSLKTEDLYIREKLALSSDGYFYHPRFVQYHLGLSTALKQEEYTDSLRGSVRTNASGMEYDVRLFILPEHPYNLRLYMSRLEPVYRQLYSALTSSVESSKGAVFSYKKKPYFFNLRYTENSVESPQNFSDVRTLGVNGLYFKEYKNGRKLSLSMFYDHSSYNASSGIRGTADNYGFNNSIDLTTATLDTNISNNTFRQRTMTGRFDSERFSWHERLSVKLPLNFRSILAYHYMKDRNSSGDEAALSSINKGYELSLIHKLYQSLDTTYIYRHDATASSTGDVMSASHALMTSYSKSIPWGRFLAGMSLNRSSADNSGSISMINESHSATVGIPFSLFGQNPDPTTIHVYLMNPEFPFNRIKEINYIVTNLYNPFQIVIPNIPSDDIPAGWPDPFSVTVTYSQKSGDFRLQTTSFSYNAGFNLFNNLLNPYYAFSSTKSKVLSGSFTGIPVEETNTTAGVILQKSPFRVMAEYQLSDSNVNAYRMWKGEVNYTDALTDSSRVYLAAATTNKRYTAGTSLSETGGYTEKTTTFSANLQKYFFQRSLALSAGGAYASFRGLMKSSSYSLTSSLEWKIGKLSFSIGASGYRSKSEGLTGAGSERIHQFYFAKIRRKLF